MKKKMFITVAVLIAVGLGICALDRCGQITSASETFHTPSFNASLKSKKGSASLLTAMIYYNGGGICADGDLHFTPLQKWFERSRSKLPFLLVSGPISCDVSAGDYCASVTAGGVYAYPIQGDTLGEKISVGDEALRGGSYLIEVPLSVTGTDGGHGQYNGFCIVYSSETDGTGEDARITPTPTPVAE